MPKVEETNSWGAPSFVDDNGPRMLGPGANKPNSFNAGPKLMGPGVGNNSEWNSGPKLMGPGAERKSIE